MFFLLNAGAAPRKIVALRTQLKTHLREIADNIGSEPANMDCPLLRAFNFKVSEESNCTICQGSNLVIGEGEFLLHSSSSDEKAASDLLKFDRGFLAVDLNAAIAPSHLITASLNCNAQIEVVDPQLSMQPLKGLFNRLEAERQAAERRCDFPTSHQLRVWAAQMVVENRSVRRGIYWLAHERAEYGFANYLHVPSLQKVEYGNLVFDANLVLICSLSIRHRTSLFGQTSWMNPPPTKTSKRTMKCREL